MSKWFKHKNAWYNLDKYRVVVLRMEKEILLRDGSSSENEQIDIFEFNTNQERDEAFHEIGNLLRRNHATSKR